MLEVIFLCSEKTSYWSQLNPVEICLGFGLGIVSSFIYAYTSNKITSNTITKRHKIIAGNYIRYWSINNTKENNKIFSSAKLTQLFENKFQIEVTTFLYYGQNNSLDGTPFEEERQEIWSGEVTMDSLRNGTIVWEQIQPKNNNNGFKRLIIDKNHTGITIVGEKDGGFGIERFDYKINL